MLHDVNEERLLRAHRVAAKLNAANGAPVILDHSTDPAAALEGADFCLSSAEFGRFRYWRQDYEVPRRHGATQITGENGGPGAVFHSLRTIRNTLGICADIERHCPDTFLLNLSNPMSRVTLAINRATKVANVGMCHEGPIGVTRLGKLLRIKPEHIEAKASGINHFTFFTELRDRRSGEDLLPRVRALYQKPIFDFSPGPSRWPGGRCGFLASAPSPSSSMPRSSCTWSASTAWCPARSTATSASTCRSPPRSARGTRPRSNLFEDLDRQSERLATWVADTKLPLPLHRLGHSLEEVVPIIAARWTGVPTHVMAVNVPNRGWIPNVVDGAIVEVGATVDGDGIHPDTMPAIAEPVAGHIATQVALQELVVEAALTGDPEPALRAVIEDPLSPPDEAACRALFDELMGLQAAELPF